MQQCPNHWRVTLLMIRSEPQELRYDFPVHSAQTFNYYVHQDAEGSLKHGSIKTLSKQRPLNEGVLLIMKKMNATENIIF